MANICITGIWHQGAIVSACLADLGHNVRGVCDKQTAAVLNAGNPPVYEPLLQSILEQNVTAGRLRYTADYSEGLAGAEFVYICTDTPVDTQDDSDLTPVYQIAEIIGQHLTRDIVLCVTAQVPVGTSEDLARTMRDQASGHDCQVVYIPEFLRLGEAVNSFRQTDRIVIGAADQTVAERVATIYKALDRPIVFTDLRSAEMAKHAANAFLATSISFINEIANLCDALNADAQEVARILKLDRRIGQHAFLSPGLGFAGGTLGREIRSLQNFGLQHQVSTPLMDAVWSVNTNRAQLIGRQLAGALGSLQGRQIGVLGLTYKPGTSTLRRAISLDIARDLSRQGAVVTAFDPLAELSEVSALPPMRVCKDPYEAAEGSDALVLVTEWANIGDLDIGQLRKAMRGDIFMDTRNLMDPALMRQAGFRYFGIGR